MPESKPCDNLAGVMRIELVSYSPTDGKSWPTAGSNPRPLNHMSAVLTTRLPLVRVRVRLTLTLTLTLLEQKEIDQDYIMH